MKKFEIKKDNTETLDVGGEEFEVDVSAKNVKEVVLKGHELREYAKKIEEMSEDPTKEEQLKVIDELEKVLKETTDFVLGDGSFGKLYPKTGESFLVMSDVLFQVIDYLYGKQQKEAEKQKAKYVKNRKR